MKDASWRPSLIVRCLRLSFLVLLVISNSACASSYRSYEIAGIRPISKGDKLSVVVIDKDVDISEPFLAHGLEIENKRSDAYLIELDLSNKVPAKAIAKVDVLKWLKNRRTVLPEIGAFLPNSQIFNADEIGAKLCNEGLRSWSYSPGGATLLCDSSLFVFTIDIKEPSFVGKLGDIVSSKEGVSTAEKSLARYFQAHLNEKGDTAYLFRRGHSTWEDGIPQISSDNVFELSLKGEGIKAHKILLGLREFPESVHLKEGRVIVFAKRLHEKNDTPKSQVLIDVAATNLADYQAMREYSPQCDCLYSVKIEKPYEEAEIVVEKTSREGGRSIVLKQKVRDLK